MFNCVVAGYPTPDVAWTKNEAELNVAADARLRVSSNDGNHQLTISNVQQSNAGQYRCVANNSLATVTSSSAALTVHCESKSNSSVKSASVEYSCIFFVLFSLFFSVFVFFLHKQLRSFVSETLPIFKICIRICSGFECNC